MNASEICPVSGARGTLRRVRTGQELAASYGPYHGQSVPAGLVEKYFTQTVGEYQCEQSGLRWYAPTRLGESDFYEWLAQAFPWYYSHLPTWDKLATLDILRQIGTRGFVEIGSGGGVFLKLARDLGIKGIGTEINTQAIESSRAQGLEVYHAEETPAVSFPLDTIVSLQSLEHVIDPVSYLRKVLEKFPVPQVVIAVPCFETMLGHTLDPLAWPPHHYTAWSKKSLETLGGLLGYRLDSVRYEPLGFHGYRDAVSRERALEHSQLWAFPGGGIISKVLFKVLQKTSLPWLSYRHSIVVAMSRVTS